MDVTVDTALTIGTYYIKIDGTGNINVGEYGSLGSYTLSGTTGALPIHDVTLTGTVDKTLHNLSWNIIADEPIKTIGVERSNDGVNFNTLTNVAGTASKFTYAPYQVNTVYYRLKVTSVLDQTMYSNTVALKGTDKADKLFSVSTLVQSEVSVNASVNYQYLLSDVNGRMISTGNALKGINKLNISNQPAGMYIIQLFNNSERQTERIIKQ
jgi:hypothetical protein